MSVSSSEPAFMAYAGLVLVPECIPVPLQHVPQWVLWKAEPKPKGKGMNKIPYQLSGRKASASDPATWTDYADALAAYEEAPDLYSGIGFAFSKDDAFIGGDIDHCRNAETGELTPLAARIVSGIDTYWEVSPSGTGLRFIGRGEQVRSFVGNGLEVYTSGRYLTMTGAQFTDCADINEIPRNVIDRLHHHAKGTQNRAVAVSTSSAQHYDPLVRAAKEHGLYQRDLGDGRHAFTCPWWHEHTDGDITGTVYMEAFHNGFEYPKFVCQHAHCANRNLTDVNAYLGLVPMAAEKAVDGVVVEEEPADPMAWLADFHISQEAMDKVAHPEWIYPNLVIQGHVIAIVAAPNGGKTTIMLQVAADMVDAGKRVVYVNADVSGGDAKDMKAFADAHGIELVLPDMIAGKSMQDIVENLEAMTRSDRDISNMVFIFDTLKKMTNVIHKQQSASLYKTLRSLSGKGMTSIALGHTNKYKDADGKPIFEGTGDLRADVDELIYLTGDKNADGSMVVSTMPDKVRGAFEPISFQFGKDRVVTRCGYIDVGEETRRRKQYAKDLDAIEAIQAALGDTPIPKSDLIDNVRKHGFGRDRLRKVLDRYCGPDAPRECWIKEVGFGRNVIKFRRIKTTLVSSDKTSVSGDSDDF